MASIFKRTKKKGEPYLIQYVDHLGKRKTVIGFTDKGLTEELASKLEGEARLRRLGLIDTAAEELLEKKKLPIDGHLNEFQKSLSNNTDKYINLTMYRVRRIVDGCQISNLADVSPENVTTFLDGLRGEDGMGHRTFNHYLQAFDAFLNWCVKTKRLATNPMIGTKRLNNETDVRHPRRALSPDEVSRLIRTVQQSRKRYQNIHRDTREKIYTIAYLTGLRKQEIASLTPAHFQLQLSPPTLTVEAKRSEHRKKDVLPLHPQLAELLPLWTEGMKPGQKLFPGLERKKLSEMVKRDLRDAGIEYENEQGIADFHATGRHT